LEFYCSEFQAMESPGKSIGPGKCWEVLELSARGSGICSSGLSSRKAVKQFLLIHCHLLGQYLYTVKYDTCVYKGEPPFAFALVQRRSLMQPVFVTGTYTGKSWKKGFFSPGIPWNLVFASPGKKHFNVCTNLGFKLRIATVSAVYCT